MLLTSKTGTSLIEISPAKSTTKDGKIRLEDVQLDETSVDELDARGLQFDLGEMDGIVCRKAFFLDCAFVGTIITEGNFEDSVFERVSFYDVQALDAVFRRCVLTDVSFKGANLSGADFRGATLNSVYFSADNVGVITDLRGADLGGVDLINAQFEQAAYDESTIFPGDFNPKSINGLVQRVR